MPDLPPLRVAVQHAGLTRRRLSSRIYTAARGSIVAATLAIAAIVVFGLAKTPLGNGLVLVALAGIGAAPVLGVAGWLASLLRGSVRDAVLVVDAKGARVDGARSPLVRREEVASGIVVPRGTAWDVELETRGGDVARVGVADESSADRLLAALGLGAAQRRTTVRFARLFSRLALGFATFVVLTWISMIAARIVAGPAGAPAAMGIGSLCAYPLAALLIGPINRALLWTEVIVGVDGLSVRKGLSRRFIPFADVVRAELYNRRFMGRGRTIDVPGGIELWKADGSSEQVPLDPDDAQLRTAILQRIRQSLAVRRAADEPEALLDALARKGRTATSWRRDLSQLWRDAAYRDRVVRREDVAVALEDVAAPAEQRVGAAIALVASGDPEAPARVRIAADACADPALREALTAIAADEESDAVIDAAVGRAES
jgi:hypothetical protein